MSPLQYYLIAGSLFAITLLRKPVLKRLRIFEQAYKADDRIELGLLLMAVPLLVSGLHVGSAPPAEFETVRTITAAFVLLGLAFVALGARTEVRRWLRTPPPE